MIDHEPDIPQLTGTPLGTTGRELREAREAKGWDINSLSETLHLRPAVLIAIEEGDYREVPELFLKGYVRSYGRIVGLEGNRLIRQLESELQPLRQEEAERHVESPIFHIEVKKRKKRRIAFWVLLIAFFAVLVFGFMRFQSMGYDLGLGGILSGEQKSGSGSAETEGLEEPAGPEAQVLGLNRDDSPVQEENTPIPDSAPEAGESFPPVPAESADEPVQADPESIALAPATVPSGQTEGEAPQPEENAGPESSNVREEQGSTPDALTAQPVASADAPAQEEAGTEPEPDVPGDEVATESEPGMAEPEPQSAALTEFLLEFDDDCWIEIRNSDGQRIYAGLQSAGDRLSRAAEAPVNFVIGNIDGIESFTFNGEPVEIREYPSRNGRSEITLNANSGT